VTEAAKAHSVRDADAKADAKADGRLKETERESARGGETSVEISRT
jgi:hypothetical protein